MVPCRKVIEKAEVSDAEKEDLYNGYDWIYDEFPLSYCPDATELSVWSGEEYHALYL